MKKIIAVKFDDGTEADVRDARALEQYLAAMRLQEAIRSMAAADVDWPAIEKQHEQRKALRLKKRETKRENARKPRHEFAKDSNAKAKLLAFKDQYEINEAKTHGWLAAACREFKSDPNTLKRILRRP